MKLFTKIIFGLLALTLSVSAETKKPNIIFIMTDDQGYGDLGCHGHPFLKTPNIDKLYSQSTRFTDYHVSPTCAPTRAALMSGRLPFAVGVTHTILERERMALGVPTIAEVLKSSGYTTAIFGKWHLGEEDAYQPHSRGFEEVFIHGAGGIGQNFAGSQGDAPGTSYFNPILRHNNTFVQTKGYCTDVFFQQALGWIKENKNKPFFAYIATNAPHGPFIVADKYREMYEGQKGVKDKNTASFFGMITNIDENVGQLMAKLDEWDLAGNTLLIYTTDNGSSRGSKIFNAGMNGGKGSLHQGGSRVPMIVRLPGVAKAGVEIDALSRHIDIFPTLAELAGADISKIDLRGRSLLPLMKDPKTEWAERHMFFHGGRWAKKGAPSRFDKGSTDPEDFKFQKCALRNKKWRLVNGSQLYEIENDPSEKNDVSHKHPEVVQKMRKIYAIEWDRLRPLMINEDASLDVPKPFLEMFKKQKATKGIPEWNMPQL